MGDIDSSPRFLWGKAFELRCNGVEAIFHLEINKSESLQEGGGVADPSIPSGPDNRNIYLAIEYGAWVRDEQGELIHFSKLPSPFNGFMEKLSEKASSGEELPIDFFENDLESNLVSWAKTEFSIEVVSKGDVDHSVF